MDRFAWLAIYLHKRFCTRSHADECGWYYEANLDESPRKVQKPLWDQPAHKEWYKKAQEVYAQVQEIW